MPKVVILALLLLLMMACQQKSMVSTAQPVLEQEPVSEASVRHLAKGFFVKTFPRGVTIMTTDAEYQQFLDIYGRQFRLKGDVDFSKETVAFVTSGPQGSPSKSLKIISVGIIPADDVVALEIALFDANPEDATTQVVVSPYLLFSIPRPGVKEAQVTWVEE